MKKPLSSHLRDNAMADGCNDLKVMKQRVLFYAFPSGSVVLLKRKQDGGNNGIVKAMRNVFEM